LANKRVCAEIMLKPKSCIMIIVFFG